MTDTFFVRREMLPEESPPPSSVGLVGWLRENLFSNWQNTILPSFPLPLSTTFSLA